MNDRRTAGYAGVYIGIGFIVWVAELFWGSGIWPYVILGLGVILLGRGLYLATES